MPYSYFPSQKLTLVFQKFQHTAFNFVIKGFWNMWIFRIFSCFDGKGFLFGGSIFIQRIILFWLLFNWLCFDDDIDLILVPFTSGLLLVVFLNLLLCYGHEIALSVNCELWRLHRRLTCPTCSILLALRWPLRLKRRNERHLRKAIGMLVYHQFSSFVWQIDFVDVLIYLHVKISGSLIGKRDDS